MKVRLAGSESAETHSPEMKLDLECENKNQFSLISIFFLNPFTPK